MQQTKNLAQSFLPATNLDFLSSHSLFLNLNTAVGRNLRLSRKESLLICLYDFIGTTLTYIWKTEVKTTTNQSKSRKQSSETCAAVFKI